MRVIASLIAIAGVIGLAMPVQAAPVAAMHREAGAAPPITLVWQRCGHGFHRGHGAWVDKGGGWHGPCVPNRRKEAGQNPSSGGMTTEQLNQQELSRLQAGAPPAQ